MSSGTFTETVALSFTVHTFRGKFKVEDLEAEIEGTFEYDAGYWRDANGDGLPPSVDVEIAVLDLSSVVAAAKEQLDEAGEVLDGDDGYLADAIIKAADKAIDKCAPWAR